ncbi:hypothetical protein BDY17DRAFT_135153 [Neohortaea acidophila]|uniref:Zn(2)-C6 fungal-type domain-containing protein n=1 Tax=Neohortaea acidophila TaxID=245834 RepID=A0A6A6PXM3_9PEZI|nr:uncharacterized protein BDY17DRAFT_135153 [Neohortaea acidophila]KAF2484765.1 hypothetical protein BDY17DRAFT_135153 [Neohortaea acidophila]
MDSSNRKRKRVLTLPPSSNGCITCRSRRVKCDETRPFCRRCVQARRTCKGYAAAWPAANAPPEPAEEVCTAAVPADSPAYVHGH